jgi:GGDEF domain-containing protein
LHSKPAELLAAVSELTKTIHALLSLEENADVLEARQQLGTLLSGALGKLDVGPKPPDYTPDQLTGLQPRASAELELRQEHARLTDCHLALFVVKRLALINAKFGYARGNDVLLKVVAHLAQSLGQSTALFRWTPCAFLGISPADCSYKDLQSKVQAIELARLTPTLEWEGRSAMVHVMIDGRMLSVRDFGSTSDLFLRLDTLAADG